VTRNLLPLKGFRPIPELPTPLRQRILREICPELKVPGREPDRLPRSSITVIKTIEAIILLPHMSSWC